MLWAPGAAAPQMPAAGPGLPARGAPGAAPMSPSQAARHYFPVREVGACTGLSSRPLSARPLSSRPPPDDAPAIGPGTYCLPRHPPRIIPSFLEYISIT
jgi:hypothetical protein